MLCRKCKEDKAESEFNWKIKAKAIRQTICSPCQSEQTRLYREASGQRYSESAKAKYASNKERINAKRRQEYALLPDDEKAAKQARCREYNATDAGKKRSKDRRSKNPTYFREHSKRWSKSVPGRQWYRDQRSIIRTETLEYYGGACTCCGETEEVFLTLDHINNDGASHRKSGEGAKDLYRWAKRRSFPDTLQILCRNCNWAKHISGICPHKK